MNYSKTRTAAALSTSISTMSDPLTPAELADPDYAAVIHTRMLAIVADAQERYTAACREGRTCDAIHDASGVVLILLDYMGMAAVDSTFPPIAPVDAAFSWAVDAVVGSN